MELIVHAEQYLLGGKWLPFGSLTAVVLNLPKEEVSQADALSRESGEQALQRLAELGLAPVKSSPASESSAILDELIAFRVYMRRWLSRLAPGASAEKTINSLSQTVSQLEAQLRKPDRLRRTTLPLEINSKHEFIFISSGGKDDICAERIVFPSLRELLLYDTLRAAELGRAPRSCACCSAWFVPSRRNEIFCAGVAQNGRPCRDFGAQQRFKQRSSSELRPAFDAACSRIYTRKSRKKISAEESRKLLAAVREQYENARAADLSKEEFEQQLAKFV